ncbi:MAG: DUF805 domain-containing protein [Erythrobacter sp.]|nr:MAG: DUF805 domain-containing protein [Erythrobacter sp.]
MGWMILPLKRYADFSGRSRRMEFWMFTLFFWIVTIVLGLIAMSGIPWTGLESWNPEQEWGGTIMFMIGAVLLVIWWLGTLVPVTAVTVRRLHDRGLSGWWYGGLIIAGFVPLVNMITFPGYLVLLVFLCLPSQEGTNKWGPSPFDPGMASVFR